MEDIRTQEVNNLLRVISQIDSPDEVYNLLEDLLTVREIREMSLRLEVARLLSQGNPYSAIEKATGTSATTIARVSKCLGYGSGGYKRALAILQESAQADN